MSEITYLAIAFSSRTANGHLRAAVTAAAPPDAKVVRTRPDVIAAVFEVDRSADARSEGERLRRQVAIDAQDAELSVAVSGPKRGTTGAHFALLQADQAVSLSRTNGGKAKTTHFEDLGPYRFVLGKPESDIEDFAATVLGPLVDDDRYADLLKTLEAYLKLRSVNGVARELYLHRNTVRQRLCRIGQLTGAKLNDADDRLALQLALLGHQALERIAL
jgi:DNA-binding PucR family transcriptional regulator